TICLLFEPELTGFGAGFDSAATNCIRIGFHHIQEGTMAKSAFRLALEDAIEQRHSAVHPWSEAWTSGKLDRRLLGEWVKQHFHYVSHFAEWVAAVYANCPHPDVQHFLLENVTEEEGRVGMGGAAPVRHSDLLLEFGETCGKSREEVSNAQINGELLPETLGLQSW